MKRGYADTQCGQVHYHAGGDGDLLILLHAATHSGEMFTRLLPELKSSYTVVAPDIPGFGNSDPLGDETTIPELAGAMTDVVDAFDAHQARVFGLHTGNKIGTAMGARYPDRVGNLLLCGLPHSIIPDETRRDAVIADIVADSLVDFSPTAGGAHHLKEWATLHRKVTDTWWDSDILSADEISAVDIDRLAATVVDTIRSRDTLERMYEANFEYDLTADLAAIEPRTLVLELSTPEELSRYGSQYERVAEVIPDATGRQLEADVDTFFENPEAIAELILDFLGRG